MLPSVLGGPMFDIFHFEKYAVVMRDPNIVSPPHPKYVELLQKAHSR